MSWPSRNKRGSRSISSAIARANASRKKSLGIEQRRLGIGPGSSLGKTLRFGYFGIHFRPDARPERIVQDCFGAQPPLVEQQRIPVAQLLQFHRRALLAGQGRVRGQPRALQLEEERAELSAAGVVTTVAGNGVQGFAGDNGPAIAAELDTPMGLAVDATGNLYIADSHNHRVRVVTAATGVIATVAGTGAAGFFGDGGPAKAAMLDLPTALALDSAGNVYVADTDNHRIRRIAAATGKIATVAGNGVEGFAGDAGPATAASIDSPSGLAVDAAGNLYLADTHNGRVRAGAAATGGISTLAGVGAVGGNVQAFGGDGGPATAAGMVLPRGLTLDAAGELYIG